MENLNCPKCGSPINYELNNRLVQCQFCHSSLMLETLLNHHPLQIPLNKKLLINRQSYQIQNIIQYSHCQGIRSEYLLVNQLGEEFHLSKDDEDVALLKTIRLQNINSNKPLEYNSLEPNTQVIIDGFEWLVTEKRQMITFPDKQFNYIYLTGENAELLVLIFTGLTVESLSEIRQGFWLSPFDLFLQS